MLEKSCREQDGSNKIPPGTHTTQKQDSTKHVFKQMNLKKL